MEYAGRGITDRNGLARLIASSEEASDVDSFISARSDGFRSARAGCSQQRHRLEEKIHVRPRQLIRVSAVQSHLPVRWVDDVLL